jgi:uncharacterized small protein (DUF1192 family)
MENPFGKSRKHCYAGARQNRQRNDFSQEFLMDLDDILPKRPDDPLVQVLRQDLDRLSLDELRDRITILTAEIARVQTKLEGATKFRSVADSLFKK